MITFSKGTEWIKASQKYCSRCVNYRDRYDNRGAGCPIDDMHMEGELETMIQAIPDSLVGNEFEFPQCSMFLERGK
jgi:hypothetical protein